MTITNFRPALCAMIIVLGLPGVAAAAKAPRPNLPDGYSGIQQYTESIPTAGGQRATGSIPRSSGSADQGSVPASTQGQLLNDGASGQQAASLAAATGPATGISHTTGKGKHTGTAGSGRTTTRRSSHSSAPVPAASNPPGSSGGGGSSAGSAVAASLTGGAGPGGFILPLILAIVAVGALVVRVRRRPPTS